MNGCLQLNSQPWKLRGSDGLKLLLPRQHRDGSIYFEANWSFVPPDVDTATLPADAPQLRLRLIGFVPGLRDWRDLENLFLGYHEPVDSKEPADNEDAPDTRGPDMWLWLPGETKPMRFGHWETDLKFGERRGHEFEFSLEAVIPSERASKFKLDCHLKEFFQQPLPPDWEQPEWINEVADELSFAGRFEFREILCSVPINSAQPLEWARQLARRELAVEQFGPCILSDANHPDANYKPEDGISETGRLVVLPMLAD
jgi:hypothetical protein